MHSENKRAHLRMRHIFRRMRSTLWALGTLIVALPCFAHPMGNFSISHYSEITVEHDAVTVRYLLDLAEIPTFQEMQQAGMNANHDDPKLAGYIEAKSREFGALLRISVDGRELTLIPVSRNLVFTPGAGGLPTMKFGFLYRAKIATACKLGGCELNYEDDNFQGREGWKEIVVKSEREVTLMRSTAPDQDRSGQLSNYPTDLVNSPPQALHASVSFATVSATEAGFSRAPAPTVNRARKGAESSTRLTATAQRPVDATSFPKNTSSAQPVSAPEDKIEMAPNRQKTPRNAFTEIIATKKLGLGMALLAALIAAGLGALHALEPGHGKTIVAAYLVGAKGTARHAFLLGMIVTITHTAGVYMLGAITLYAQKYILPEKLYPFLGVLSGILIAGMGFYLFLQRFVGRELSYLHTHGGIAHSHSGFFQARAASDYVTESESESRGAGSRKSIPARQLLLLGITGGIVPCPAALVVLLSGLALHRVLFGLFLIVAFSGGLAAVLIAMGMVAVYAGRLVSRANSEGPLIQRWLPLTSAVMITALGCAIAVRALMTAGIVQFHI
jgi:nickel/cobalt exporter